MQVDIGVLGVGSLGYHHARILRDLPGARLVGIHDTNGARLRQVAEELAVPSYEDRDALLSSVDAAVIAVPTAAHADVGEASLRQGVHILMEKPIAASLAEADGLLELAEARGLRVQTGHVERFNGALRAAEPYLDEPLFVESHRLAPFGPRGTDVDVVLDLMIHDLDLVLSLMPRPVTRVAAAGIPVLTQGPDIANARIEFEGGAVANLTASRVSLERLRKFRLFQRSGYASLDLAAGRGEFLRLRPGFQLDPGVPLAATGLEEVVERIPLESDGAEPLARELEAFITAVRGEAPVVVSGRDGRRALGVALEIIKLIDSHVAFANPA